MNIKYKNISYSLSDFIELSASYDADKKWEKDIFEFVQSWFDSEDDFIAYTSGSSGEAKAIRIKKEYARASASRTIDFFGLKKRQKVLISLPSSFIAGKMMFVRAFEAELDIIIEEPSTNPLKHLNEDIDFIAMSPHQLHHTLEKNPERVNLVSTILLGGAPVGKQLDKSIKDLHCAVYLGYGMTETVTHIALRRMNGPDSSEIYKTVEGVELSIDENQQLIISVAHLGIEKMLTNDIVQLQDNHSFEWLGRADRIINSGGIKVNPEKLENQLSEFISEAYFLFGREDKVLGQRIELFVECIDEKYILEDIKKVNTLIKAIHHLKEFQRTHSGKIDRLKTIDSLDSDSA